MRDLVEKPGLVQVLPRELARLKNTVSGDSPAFELDGTKITDRDSFFEVVRTATPSNPPVLSCNWDALADSMWGGLHNLAGGRVVVFWSHAAGMQGGAPSDYQTALDVLADVAAPRSLRPKPL